MPEVKQLKELRAAGQAAKCEFFVQWHLTERCNLRCLHCYQGDPAPSLRGTSSDLSLAECREVASEVSEMLKAWAEAYGIEFSPSFNVTGGEPFLRDDIFEVLSEISRRGFGISLLTNGTLIGKRRAELLADFGVGTVQVSIEGHETVHDGIRGRGSFAAAMRGVENLLDAGMEVTLNVTLSRLNSPFIAEIIGLARFLGVQRLGFARLVPSGRGAALLEQMLPPFQLREAYRAIFSEGGPVLRTPGLEIVTGDPVAAAASDGHFTGGSDCGPFGGCAAGVSGITILADGTVTPCRRLPLPIGNIKKDSLRELWATSEVLGYLRDKAKYKGRCGSCDKWSGCRGCRAIAYAATGFGGKADFLAEDPQCFVGSQ